ncbi:MAG: alkaline phosphatase PhoX [Parasphingorhabdus sp.]|uniref:alkaline phosphatase PhoX n=1 Tax=Parasphingorhabdus sp. TaxID=2709688 RepID=UPI0030013D65
MQLNRRNFTGGLTALAFSGLAQHSSLARTGATRSHKGYGPLQVDPNGLLDLPRGFSYHILSEFRGAMSDGNRVPDRADGMGCFAMPNGKLALVRNHELKANHFDDGPFTAMPSTLAAYDYNQNGKPLVGGTTTMILDNQTLVMERQHLSLVGTIRNCAGGTTPWGSWLSCEEDVTRAGDGVTRDHGWVFEVPAAEKGLVDPVPLKAMGRFNHEAAAVDPATGIVYLTEDRDDSLFYRFIPDVPGKLAEGGKLQALAFAKDTLDNDSRNWSTPTFKPGAWQFASWVDLNEVESPNDDLRERGAKDGAVKFARGEGIVYGDGELYFCCTSGGAAKEGQIMRYRPSRYEGLEAEAKAPGLLQLFMESTDRRQYSFGDNLTIAPNGHLIVCEDQYSATVDNHLRGVTPHGKAYALGRIRIQTEPAGACFSPDGRTMFLNLYSPTKTLAILGPWNKLR